MIRHFLAEDFQVNDKVKLRAGMALDIHQIHGDRHAVCTLEGEDFDAFSSTRSGFLVPLRLIREVTYEIREISSEILGGEV